MSWRGGRRISIGGGSPMKRWCIWDRAIELDASFAEAYNQRAIVHYLCERYEHSAVDCQAAISRITMPFRRVGGNGAHCNGAPGEDG